jgi:hypothetical protein
MFGNAFWEMTHPIGCIQSYWNFWLSLKAKLIAIPSMPHHENERQLSINDYWSCIMGHLVGDSLQIVIN